MERLTEKMHGRYRVKPGYALDTLKGARAVVDRLGAYEDTGWEPEVLRHLFTNEDSTLALAAMCLAITPDRLRELVRADRDHRLVVLPFPIGSQFYDTLRIRRSGTITDYIQVKMTITHYYVWPDKLMAFAHNRQYGITASYSTSELRKLMEAAQEGDAANEV